MRMGWRHGAVRRLALALGLVALLAVAWPARAATVIRDAEIEETIRRIADPIFNAAGLDPDSVDIIILRDDTLNAFVAGGQNLFLNTGLLTRTENPDQLAGRDRARDRPHRRRPSEPRRRRPRAGHGAEPPGCRAGGRRRRRRGAAGGHRHHRRRCHRGAARRAGLLPRPGAVGGPGGRDLPRRCRPLARGPGRVLPDPGEPEPAHQQRRQRLPPHPPA